MDSTFFRFILFLLLLLFAGQGVASAGSAAKDDLGCLIEMEVPRYSALARLALKTGIVEVYVTVGPNGKVADVRAKGPDPRLAEEIEEVLKAESAFDASCKGQRVRMLFTFRLEGEATSYPYVIVRFRPPNHFVIISQPRLPHVLHRPSTFDSKKPSEHR